MRRAPNRRDRERNRTVPAWNKPKNPAAYWTNQMARPKNLRYCLATPPRMKTPVWCFLESIEGDVAVMSRKDGRRDFRCHINDIYVG